MILPYEIIDAFSILIITPGSMVSVTSGLMIRSYVMMYGFPFAVQVVFSVMDPVTRVPTIENTAVMLLSASIVMVNGLVEPDASPLHFVKTYPVFGTAVNSTILPA